MPNSIYPIYSLLDVDPYNKGVFRNDSDTYKKAIEFYSNPNHVKDYNDAYSEVRGRKMAPTLSAIGSLISLIPHGAAKIIGGLMQVPDIYYDAKDFANDPSSTNGIHLALDGLQFVPGLTKYVRDDILGIPGFIDDGYTAVTGRDGLEDIQGIKKKIQIKKKVQGIKDGLKGIQGIKKKVQSKKPITKKK